MASETKVGGQVAKFLGTTDDVTTCDCCGRSNLKSTVALLIGDAADPVYYGVTCAAHALSRPAKEIRSESRKADDDRRASEAAERDARFRAQFAAEQAVLDRWFPALAGSYNARAEQVQAMRASGRTFADLRSAVA